MSGNEGTGYYQCTECKQGTDPYIAPKKRVKKEKLAPDGNSVTQDWKNTPFVPKTIQKYNDLVLRVAKMDDVTIDGVTLSWTEKECSHEVCKECEESIVRRLNLPFKWHTTLRILLLITLGTLLGIFLTLIYLRYTCIGFATMSDLAEFFLL